MTKATPIVLYVDDDVANRIVFEQSFKQRFPLEVVADGEAALRRLEDGPISVLLTDQRMPGMTGNELLRELRARSPETVGIVVTAYDDVQPILDAVNSGFVGRYIVKPWTTQDVIMAVNWGLEVYDLACKKQDLELKLIKGERLSTFGAMSAGIMHDLNQPVASLSTNLEFMTVVGAKLADPGLPPGQVPQLAREMNEALGDAGVAVEQIRAVTESGTRFLAGTRAGPARGEPGTAARYTVTLCSPQVMRSRGTLRHDIAPDLPLVTMPTSGLTQVMVNLVMNSAQALGHRPGGQVELSIRPEGGGVRIVVRDTGSGMPPEVLAQVRQPFFTTKPPGSGTGLGLFNTQRLVDEAGGTMAIESTVGQGTSVSLWLPESRS